MWAITCDNCGADLSDYSDVGYDGPLNKECLDTCHPFMPWKILCKTCCGVTVFFWPDGCWTLESEYNGAEYAYRSDDFGRLCVSEDATVEQIDAMVREKLS